MSEFFRAGGVAMVPVLLFGTLAIAVSVLSALRPEGRYLWPTVALALTSIASGLLGTSLGLINVFRYLQHVPAEEHALILTAGAAESLHPVALALILTVITGLVTSVAGFRASRAPAPAR